MARPRSSSSRSSVWSCSAPRSRSSCGFSAEIASRPLLPDRRQAASRDGACRSSSTARRPSSGRRCPTRSRRASLLAQLLPRAAAELVGRRVLRAALHERLLRDALRHLVAARLHTPARRDNRSLDTVPSSPSSAPRSASGTRVGAVAVRLHVGVLADAALREAVLMTSSGILLAHALTTWVLSFSSFGAGCRRVHLSSVKPSGTRPCALAVVG